MCFLPKAFQKYYMGINKGLYYKPLFISCFKVELGIYKVPLIFHFKVQMRPFRMLIIHAVRSVADEVALFDGLSLLHLDVIGKGFIDGYQFVVVLDYHDVTVKEVFVYVLNHPVVAGVNLGAAVGLEVDGAVRPVITKRCR